MNKIIYTITFQFARNYGALLQAYALHTFLRKNGIETWVIDYWPKYAEKNFGPAKLSKSFTSIKDLLRHISNFYLQAKFDRFKRKNIRLTKKCSTIFDIESLPKAEAMIVGSDQIWNPILLGELDDVYTLNFEFEGIKASYAASVGQDKLDIEQLKTLINRIKTFDYISVREKNLQEDLLQYGINEVTHSLDPVFLLDLEEYMQIVKRPSKKDYILLYYTDGLGITDSLARKLSEMNNNIPIYKIGTHSKKNKIIGIPNPGVGSFLGLIKYAKFVITSSFHGTAFAIIFKKNFFSVKAGDRSSRIISLLDSLGLLSRYIDEMPENIHGLNLEVDYKKFEENTIDQIEKARQYLLNIINNIT
jgi:hypothetical protein